MPYGYEPLEQPDDQQRFVIDFRGRGNGERQERRQTVAQAENRFRAVPLGQHAARQLHDHVQYVKRAEYRITLVLVPFENVIVVFLEQTIRQTVPSDR